MDSQVLPLPMFSHQMAIHSRMNAYDPAPIHRASYQPAVDRLERRPHGGSIPNYSSRTNSHSSSSNYITQARTVQRSESPTPSASSSRRTGESQRQHSVSNDSILPHLQIPASINASGGSLAEFAAQITCLFWFESTETVNIAERSTSSPLVRPLVREAIPGIGFQKWVVSLLSTTQVTQNVILLALLFIYRLKKHNPTVKGRGGSEYRLLTVALMLGNKFLDDNTYTNKTWAEVSGITVQEIHVMEVEFLSNMRYNLLASEDQWEEWKMKLGNFYDYFERASRAPSLPSPSGYRSPLLPSPPVSMQSSPPHLAGRPPAPNSFPQTSSMYTAPPISPLPSMPDLALRPASRKRSYDDNSEERPAKRINPSQPSIATPAHSARLSNRQNLPRLPMPSLTIPIREPMHPVSGNYSVQNGTVLPPLNGRSMSTVYPTTPGYNHQQPLLTPTGTQAPSQSFNTPSRHHSPRSIQDLLSIGSSPVSASFPRGPNSSFSHNNSPSIFYQQRSSPYKPVRHVNTLLHPPPHSSTQGPLAANMAPRQMHYQPLGKRNDYRTGIVPEFQGYHQWHGHSLPQPNFHA